MAISQVIAPTAVSAGTTSIDTTGADFFWLVCGGYNSGFTAGIAPSVKTYNGTDMGLLLNQTGGSFGTTTGSFLMYYLTGFSAGTHNLVITTGAGSFGQGPTYVYGALSGVVQSATATDVRRSPTVDSSTGTSISLTPTGLTVGDYLMFFELDQTDNAHTPSGVNVEDLETINNSQNVGCGHFLATGTSHTGGWTAGNVMIGLVIPIIAATSADVTALPTGVAGTGAVGSPTIITSCTFVPTGVSGSGAVGNPTIITGQLVVPTGVAGTTGLGTVSVVADVSVSISGVSGTGAAGDPTISLVTNVTVIPDGVVGTTALGELTLLGFDVWTAISQAATTWVNLSPGASPWGSVTPNITTWTNTSSGSNPWTDATDHSDTWNDQ